MGMFMGVRQMGVRLVGVRRMVLAACMSLVLASTASAFESDQFTLPPEPLHDIGPALQEKVHTILTEIVTDLNARIAAHQRAAETAPTAAQQRHHEQQVKRLLQAPRIAEALYDAFGEGWPEAKAEQWLKTHEFDTDDPVRYRPSYDSSTFGAAAMYKPLILFGMSPTLKVFDVHLGTDKAGHFFQQGFEYYEIYCEARGRNISHKEALQKAIDQGVEQEQTVYGEGTSGVYSNADLAANYAGLKFYLNLTHSVKVGDAYQPPILARDNQRWKLTMDHGTSYLKPFISNRWNEAMNPPRFAPVLRRTIREAVREQRDDWLAHYGMTQDEEAQRTQRLATWHGEPYGHSGFDGLITVAEVFFDGPVRTAKADDTDPQFVDGEQAEP